MSEINELIGELKGRYRSWRRRADTRSGPRELEEAFDTPPDIEFRPVDPRLSDNALPLNAFSALSLAWIGARCAPDVFAQGLQCCLNGNVTRVHAHSGRMTGTVREQRYYDQEILLRDGTMLASCSCGQPAPLALSLSEQTVSQAGGANADDLARTLPCKHVVAILLAYMQPLESDASGAARSLDLTRAPAPVPAKLVCPITRQPLDPARPLFQCEQCGMCYSAEGWKFLLKSDKGRCCGCESQNTVKLVIV